MARETAADKQARFEIVAKFFSWKKDTLSPRQRRRLARLAHRLRRDWKDEGGVETMGQAVQAEETNRGQPIDIDFGGGQ